MAAVTLPTHYRNVFAEQGYAQAEIDARIENANYGSAIDHLKYRHDEFHLVPVLDESGNIAGRNFIENARTKNISEIHVQMMENGNRTTDSTKAPPAQKHNAFRCRGCCGSVQPVSQNHQSSIVILVMTGICLGLFQVSGP